MSFFIGRGFAELQILKKWKWPYLLFGIGRGFAEVQILKTVKLNS